jgi:hypothetical protein
MTCSLNKVCKEASFVLDFFEVPLIDVDSNANAGTGTLLQREGILEWPLPLV